MVKDVSRRQVLAFVTAAAAAAPGLAITRLAIPGLANAADAPSVRVFAAASLKDALDDVGKAWQAAAPGRQVSISYASSALLAKQIEQAAPADIFISADVLWMDYVDTRKLLKPGARRNLLTNTLVLITQAGTSLAVDLKPGVDLRPIIGDSKLAMGDITSVPAGLYGRAALKSLGIWEQVAPSIANAENVRAALAFVARGEAKLGIVYGSDAKAESKVAVAGIFPPETHPPIIYPAAICASNGGVLVDDFYAFLASSDAQKTFLKWGFGIAK